MILSSFFSVANAIRLLLVVGVLAVFLVVVQSCSQPKMGLDLFAKDSHVWATWCAPCIAEMPMLDELQAKKGSANFEVVTISLDRTAEEAAQWFAKNNINNLPLWHDSTYGVSAKLALPGLPTSIFYNRQGREIARIPGEVDWTSEEALALVDYLTE